MNTLTSSSVLDRMTAELAQRRYTAISRNAPYLALARAILSDAQAEMLIQPILGHQPTPIRQSAVA
jgi:hypothetical protein